MKSTPLIMCGDMVRATFSGEKSETRRLILPRLPQSFLASHMPLTKADLEAYPCPYGGPGDELWLRERLRMDGNYVWHYEADGAVVKLAVDHPDVSSMVAWAHHQDRNICPSIHMPRWACRLRLTIERVRVQRLQEITEREARREGMAVIDGDFRLLGQPMKGKRASPMRRMFCQLWDRINADRAAWMRDPWVWAITFTNPFRKDARTGKHPNGGYAQYGCRCKGCRP